ncbi:tRNA (cytosine(38)-C(5))-methyltransferase-like [Stylophora pistillata]|nr:tRNA (cytosine(38)-C(5))-methyltransferase-like [Stylophora pistillata]
MSPPCQPFTRVGLQGASSDPRSRSFLHILELLPQLSKAPDYILMENVKGFETSDTREHFLETLNACGYNYQEFLLSPVQFGIPNSRLRYYLLAKKKPLRFCFPTSVEIMESFPDMYLHADRCHCHCSGSHGNNKITPELKERTNNHEQSTATERSVEMNQSARHNPACSKCLRRRNEGCSEVTTMNSSSQVYELKHFRRIGDYLETDKDDHYFKEFLLPGKVLCKFALLLDIVNPQSERSCCFTKAYGHYAEGTGSVLKMATIDDSDIFRRYQDLSDDKQKADLLSILKLRYFTPREVANLHCFPHDFCLPSSLSVKQQYRLLGNSLNVLVVSELLNCLFHAP